MPNRVLQLTQHPLFGDDMPALPPKANAGDRRNRSDDRRQKASLAYQCTSAAWKAQTFLFAVRDFLPSREAFIFEDLSIAYDAAAERFDYPRTEEARAFAGLRQRLVREGHIEKIDGSFRYRTQGSPSQVYRSNLYVKTHIDEVKING